MTYTSGLLLDTDVIAEVRGPDPDATVVDFLRRRRHLRIFVSALTVGELQSMARQEDFRPVGTWLHELTERYGPNILPVDAGVASAWASTPGAAEVPAVRALIAATARRGDLSVVSGRMEIYRNLGVPIIDPWAAGAPGPIT